MRIYSRIFWTTLVISLTVFAFYPCAALGQSKRAALAGSVPPWATSANFKTAAAASGNIGFRVYLGWKNASQAEALARAVSDPSNGAYRKFLTPAQFRQAFAPAQADVNTVRSWLQSQGFSIVYVPANNHYISAEGTVAQAEAAFNTQLNLYTVQGLLLRAPASALTIPSAIASVTVAVVGLDDTAQLVHTDHIVSDAPPSAAFLNAPPCSTNWAQATTASLPTADGLTTFPWVPCGYTPAQLQGAYGTAALIREGNDGTGQTVAIIDAFASPTIFQDVNVYSGLHSLPSLSPSKFTEVVAPGTYHHPEEGQKQDPQGWYGEETLDVEAVHSMAPGASIVFVSAPNSFQDLDAALNHVVDRGLAQIVSNSYGFPTEALPQGFIKPFEDTLIQAAAEGIGVYFSSGDDGDEISTVGYRTVDWPPSSPWVTAVGGTSLAVGAGNSYLFETGWGTKKSILVSGAWSPAAPGNFVYGSGGGTSRIFLQPSYQDGIVPALIADYFDTGMNWRAVPDVAVDADPNTGMLIGQTQTFPDGTTEYAEYRIGGTSLASPLMAGIMALADQAAGHPHGFVNPALYALATAGAFRDITNPASTVAAARNDYNDSVDSAAGITTSLRTMNQGGTLGTLIGYDDVTGLGTPNGASFVSALSH